MLYNRYWFLLLLGLSTLLASAPAQAVTIDFVPASPTVAVGRTVRVDVVIADLGGVNVGAFDLDVSFNPALLTPLDVIFGPFLGDLSLFEALSSFTFFPGVVDFAENTFLAAGDLEMLQPASFTLARLVFRTLAVGSSPLTLTEAIVLDASPSQTPLDVTAGSGSIGISSSAVPEPGTLLLLGSGLAGLLVWRRKVQQH